MNKNERQKRASTRAYNNGRRSTQQVHNTQKKRGTPQKYCTTPFIVDVLNIDHLLSDELKRTIGGPSTPILHTSFTFIILFPMCACAAFLCCFFLISTSLLYCLGIRKKKQQLLYRLKCYSVHFPFYNMHLRAILS